MKNKITVVFFVMVLASLLGLSVEVINPHSFLLTTGALTRVFIILILSGVWIWFSKKNEGKLLLSGTILLLFSAFVYLIYGTNSYCENAYYKESDHYQKTTPEYSCPRILKEHLLGA